MTREKITNEDQKRSPNEISKPWAAPLPQKAAQGQTVKEQLEALAAMVSPIVIDRYRKAVKYDESGNPMLNVDHRLQFEAACWREVMKWISFHRDIIKVLAQCPPDMEKQKESTLGPITPQEVMDEYNFWENWREENRRAATESAEQDSV
jgi:hypothetical protein